MNSMKMDMCCSLVNADSILRKYSVPKKLHAKHPTVDRILESCQLRRKLRQVRRIKMIHPVFKGNQMLEILKAQMVTVY